MKSWQEVVDEIMSLIKLALSLSLQQMLTNYLQGLIFRSRKSDTYFVTVKISLPFVALQRTAVLKDMRHPPVRSCISL